MKVSIDRSGCIGCGTCEALCPDVFVIESDGLAQIAVQPQEHTAPYAREAAASCPVSVIHIEED